MRIRLIDMIAAWITGRSGGADKADSESATNDRFERQGFERESARREEAYTTVFVPPFPPF